MTANMINIIFIRDHWWFYRFLILFIRYIQTVLKLPVYFNDSDYSEIWGGGAVRLLNSRISFSLLITIFC